MKNIVLACAVALAAQTAQANPIGPYDDLFVFGDSFSDPGNVYNDIYVPLRDIGFPDLDEQFNPNTSIANERIYPNNQWTDGETWAVQLSDELGYDANGATRRNWANGGARAGSDSGVQDLFEQVASFVALTDTSNHGDNPVAAIFIGGNDFLAFFDDEVEPTEPTTIPELFGGILTGIGNSIASIASTGIMDFVVFGLPDLGKQPGLTIVEATGLSQLSAELNALLQAQVEATPGASFLDIASVIDPLFGVGSPFAFSDVPCVVKGGGQIISECDNPSDYLFYDDVHPTNGVHSLIASAFTDHVTPVPLPAGAPLLLVALGALGMAARRRVAGRSD